VTLDGFFTAMPLKRCGGFVFPGLLCGALCSPAHAKPLRIAIGHPSPETLMVLERHMPELESRGLHLVVLSELIQLP
jgi:hypothetical protein